MTNTNQGAYFLSSASKNFQQEELMASKDAINDFPYGVKTVPPPLFPPIWVSTSGSFAALFEASTNFQAF